MNNDFLDAIWTGFKIGILVCLILGLFGSCSHYKYVTVPEVHTQYINKTDTVETHDTLVDYKQTIIREVDSTALAEFGIRLENQEKAFLIQSDRLQKQIANAKEVKHDTICKTDSIPKIVTVTETKTKTDYTGWLVALGIVAVIALKKKFFS